MLFSNFFFEGNSFLFTYMFLYNTTLIIFFWSILLNITTKLKTLYSFSQYSFDSASLFFITICLFSMAGVPPFVGFFSKLFILNIILNTNLLTLYFFLFILLLVGLYFYMQNLRFLHTSNKNSNDKPYLINERVPLSYYYFSITFMFFVIFGVVYIDDFLLFFNWLFV